MKQIELIDCTLGIGGELVEWAFGEDALYRLRPLLQKGGLDVIELGLLSSHTKGPNYAVYTTTDLPPAMQRRQGQAYAMLLGENRPELSTLPARSGRTVEILRVRLTPERLEDELEYCAGLRELGYQVAAMVTETARYSEKELAGLLKKAGAARVWACCIYDKSGVMDCEELEKVFACFDRSLPPDVRIGFHGGDNLDLVSELAETLCTLETGRGLLLDASVGGLNRGALGLKSEEFAQWMNQTFETHYSVPVLEPCRDLFLPHLKPKEASSMRLLYRAAAEHRCAYRYTEYLCEMEIPAEDQLDIFSEITEEDRFDFTRRAANQALMRYRKKRLNMVLVIPTANRARAIYCLLFNASRDLLRFGIDIVIYDSSDDERTYAVTANFQFEDYVNVYYQRYTGGFDGSSLDEKVMTAYREYLGYDYIWVCRDETIPLIQSCYHELLQIADHGADYIVIDDIHRNNMRWRLKEYDNCLDFFSDNSARLAILGTSIFKSSLIRDVLENEPTGGKNKGFWIPFAPLHEIAKKPYKMALVIANTMGINSGTPPKLPGDSQLLTVWAGYWYDDVMNLPDIYEPAKKAALPVQMPDFHPFHLKSVLSLRAKGGFTLSLYKKHKDRLAQVSDTPPWKFYFAALVPKSLAVLLVHMDDQSAAKPTARLSKLYRKLFDTYIRLGR